MEEFTAQELLTYVCAIPLIQFMEQIRAKLTLTNGSFCVLVNLVPRKKEELAVMEV
jgi:hypothetical protein